MTKAADKPILEGCAVLPPLGESIAPPAMPPPSPERPKPPPRRRSTADRFGVLNAFVDVALRDMQPIDAVVWLVLYRDTKPDGLARTSQKSIAARIGVSDRTVRRALVRLVAAG